MSSKLFTRRSAIDKTSGALAFAMALGLISLSAGSAAADPLRGYEVGASNGERIYGFAYTPDSRSLGACEGRRGAAILGGFAGDNASRNASCRD